jgi:nucleoside-diphosphate-sugar epimerase
MLVMYRMIAQSGLHTVPGLRPMQLSLIHADDLARGMMLVADRGERLPYDHDAVGAGVYFVASDERLTYAQWGHMISTALGRDRLRVLPIPMPAMWFACAGSQLVGWATRRPTIVNLDKHRELSAGHWTCATERIRALGFAPAASLADRLLQTVDWYRHAGWL